MSSNNLGKSTLTRGVGAALSGMPFTCGHVFVSLCKQFPLIRKSVNTYPLKTAITQNNPLAQLRKYTREERKQDAQT